MTNDKLWKGVVTLALLLAVIGLFTPYLPKAHQGDFAGAAGNMLAENYDPYIQYNGGFNTNLPVNFGSTLDVTGATTLTGTTTISGAAFDGRVLRASYTVSTTTPVRAALTNSGSAMMCVGRSLSVYSTYSSVYSPSYYFAIGTSTSATAYSASLVASTTVATTTNQVIGGTAPTWDFVLDGGSSITLSVGDNMSNASSTNYGNISGDVSILCWTLGG